MKRWTPPTLASLTASFDRQVQHARVTQPLKRAEHQPETVSLTIYGGILYKVWRVPDSNTLIPQHSHEYDHLTVVIKGLVQVWRDDKLAGEYRAPDIIKIPKHCKHRFLTLEPDCVFACVHQADTAEMVHEEHHLELEE